jgi:hypothetical protein
LYIYITPHDSQSPRRRQSDGTVTTVTPHWRAPAPRATRARERDERDDGDDGDDGDDDDDARARRDDDAFARGEDGAAVETTRDDETTRGGGVAGRRAREDAVHGAGLARKTDAVRLSESSARRGGDGKV